MCAAVYAADHEERLGVAGDATGVRGVLQAASLVRTPGRPPAVPPPAAPVEAVARPPRLP